MRLNLEDLPPRYRAQAEAQIAGRKNKKAPAEQSLAEAAAEAGKLGKAFGSRGEYEFYIGEIVPGIQAGLITHATPQVRFDLLPAKEFCGLKLPAAHYTCDYMIEYADGTVEVVEIKSKFTRRAQRDYIYRRRLFADLIAEPRGWRFREIITEDTREDLKAWKEKAVV
nr:MAG TPA: Endonuclease [Bacteriophage sp.]